MRRGRPVEREVGMEFYASEHPGTGGHLRDSPADFRVRELERFDTQLLDADTGAYPHLVFRATLTGWDTNDFASALSDRLGISRERVSWAGTKDKYAVTTQLFTVKDVDPEELPELSEADIEVVGRAGRNLHFGDLAGNAFELVVTDPDEPENATAVHEELQTFGGSEAGDEVGVPNYFGQQRFGSQRAITHEVGLEIVRGNWEDAVLAYVGNPSEREREDSRRAREYAEETRDWEGALERMPGRLRYERSILHKLVEDGGEVPEDFRAALETFPSNLQRLLVNAAQSYAFNLMLAKRLDRGLPFDRALAGDVVCFSDTDAPEDLVLPDTDRLQRVTENRVETINRHCARGRAFVTAPLVGTATELGDGEQGDIERTVLDELDIQPADFDLPGEFHSTGTRRAILLRTDVDVERDPLTFSFALPKGSYATVVMREYMKVGPEDLS